jgi:hypothetical protein
MLRGHLEFIHVYGKRGLSLSVLCIGLSAALVRA